MFDFLTKDILDSIENYSETKRFEKGALLFRQDNVCKDLFWVNDGICRIYYLHDGKEITAEFFFPESFIVSTKSFVLSQPANEFAEALTDVEVIVMSRDNFNTLKAEHPELAPVELKLVELYAIWLENRIVEFQTQDATTRYRNLIKDNPHYIRQIPLTHIASYLGISLETLSRIRAKI